MSLLTLYIDSTMLSKDYGNVSPAACKSRLTLALQAAQTVAVVALETVQDELMNIALG